MPRVIGVRFHGAGKSYHFSPGEDHYMGGEAVIVQTSQGEELGIVTGANIDLPEDKVRHPLKAVLRVANEEDEARYEDNCELEKEAYKVCRDRIRANELDMNLVDVECAFDRSKLLFYFTAEGRVDFRQLVRDLAQTFRMRIELRQIGVRDEARMVGGLGICGRPLCCTSFLQEFVPVSIKMAKEQSLSMNPSKISGCCGRLMCCLKYEQAAYEAARKSMPKVGAWVQTPQGKAKVESINLLRETLVCRDPEKPEETFTLPASDCSWPGHDGKEDREPRQPREREPRSLKELTQEASGEEKSAGGGCGGCCGHKAEGEAGSEGGCGCPAKKISEEVTPATHRAEALEEAFAAGELPAVPEWLDAEIVVEEKEEEYEELADEIEERQGSRNSRARGSRGGRNRRRRRPRRPKEGTPPAGN